MGRIPGQSWLYLYPLPQPSSASTLDDAFRRGSCASWWFQRALFACSTSKAEGRTRAEEEEVRRRGTDREAQRAKEGDRGFNRGERPAQGTGAYAEDSALPAHMPAKPCTHEGACGCKKKGADGEGGAVAQGYGARGCEGVRVGGARLRGCAGIATTRPSRRATSKRNRRDIKADAVSRRSEALVAKTLQKTLQSLHLKPLPPSSCTHHTAALSGGNLVGLLLLLLGLPPSILCTP